jgi:hypothetical protein
MEIGYIVLCARCGQALKNVYYYRGQPYGCECIQVVTGNRAEYWETRRINGQITIDEEATAERNQRRAQMQADREVRAAAAAAQGKQATIDNAWLIDALRHEAGGFCADMLSLLSSQPLDYQHFSVKQIGILSDIYARQAGRRNSRAYNAAYDDFLGHLPDD